MSILDLRVLGDPILRKDTRLIAEVTDDIRQLADDMLETMHRARGIGLAAPQVGRTERIAVVDVEEGRNPIVLINPEIVSFEGTIKGEEGCLSIPDVFADVERSARVVVRALDRNGQPFTLEGTDLLSRCLQHEIDHLHGKLFIDYLSVLKRRSALAQWAQIKDRYPDNVRRLTDEEVAQHTHDEEL